MTMSTNVKVGMSSDWTSRKIVESDYPIVLNWFSEADFFYRTAVPDTRAEWEIRELVSTDSRLILAAGEPVGLFAFEGIGPDHSCHYQLHLRLHAGIAVSLWVSAYTHLVQALRWRAELVRLTMLVAEFDDRGLEVARSLALTEEGTLAGITAHRGRRYGYVFFSQIWTPDS